MTWAGHLAPKLHGRISNRQESNAAQVQKWGFMLYLGSLVERPASVCLVGIVFAISCLVPVQGWAGAVLLIHPTLVIFEDNQRSATVHLTNHGDLTGTFEIGWVEFAMTPEGGLKKLDTPPPWSLQPYVRYSPRRVTLGPGDSQIVKVALRRKAEVAEGEYHSHFRVLTLNEEEAVDDEEAQDLSRATSIRVKARPAVAIPVIWRNSQAAPAAAIDSAEMDRGTNQLIVEVRRIGVVSVRGYLHVVRSAADGKRNALADPMPLIIYPSLDRRVISVPLHADLAANVLDSGIEVIYAPDIEITDSKPMLASYRLAN